MASSGSNIVCKFSFAKLNETCNFGSDEIKAFSRQHWSYEEKQQLLSKLAERMLDYKKALCIAKCFRGILLEILERTQNLIQRNVETKNVDHLNFSSTLSHLLHFYSFILPFVLTYFQKNGPFFSEEMNTGEHSLVIETASRFLSFSPTTFRELWNWGILYEINYSGSDTDKKSVRAIMSVVLNCNNKEISELGTESFNSSVIAQRILGEELCQTRSEDDIATANENEEDMIEIVLSEQDLLGAHTIMANMLIPKISKTILSSQELIVVPSMRKNINALTIAIVSGKSVLISGAVGSGKTALVEYFASLTGRNKPPYLFKVQLGDQTDSKALIGSYCCSDVPGEFVWRPGILTRAVREGRWLLLEDIDCAPLDVISVLIHLLESRVLSIPGKENIKAARGFQLFATQRVGQTGQGSNSESSMLEHLWSKVTIEPLTKTELKEIVVTKFPTLKPLADKLVDTFSLLSRDLQFNSKPDTRNSNLSANKRLSTVRDFMKWCRRLHALSSAGLTLLNSQDIFQEAMDCFCATVSNIEIRTSMALAIGAKLNLNKDKVEFMSNMYKPSVKVAPLCFTVGRMTLNREQADEQIEKVNFAFTRHSLILLESLAACVSQNEPVLLVGETGTGKTSAIQYLASLCNRSLVVVNMSQQSDSSDLIGGFKPMEMKQLVAPVREQFETLFCKTFSRSQNVKFLMNVQHCFAQRRWEVLFKAMMHTQQAALARISKEADASGEDLLSRWRNVGQQLQHLRQQLKHSESAQMFSFVEGALVKAIRQGDWVLLDEVNLATPETLECLNGILESQEGSVVVLERGDAEPIVRHEEFRMFACMNPANDVGKKDLPAGIRNRFTEIFVNELQDISDLKTLVFSYLQGLSPPSTLIDGVVSFYVGVREVASQKLTDGSGNRPYYSLRTLCRALKYASQNPHGNIMRSVYEGFCISFLTQLDRSSHGIVETLLQEKLLSHVNARSLIKQPLRKPDSKNEKFLNFEGYWICQGNLEPTKSSNYVFTSTVNDNLKCLARIVSGRDFPVLIQGETSVGKTSLINWLSKASGNYCVRINNHEHTDIQEYLGCYTSDASGKLVFKEGILVDAMRKGYWIILDELNLAPTDVLEALNRLLDDNRELFIPEIQETVKAHPKFMLFATQNPPGHYGGRKILSRAFRNRFVELHFEELPSNELETILHKRCSLPLSYSKTLVNVMLELQVRRRGSTVFSGKQGFITLRDLFRWADRYSKSQDSEGTFFDWSQQLAEDGYFLLAGRCRNAQEALVVQEVIEKHTKRKIIVDSIFGHPSMTKLSSFSEKILSELIYNCPQEFGHVVFTYNMRRLAVLVARSLQFNEPILLVGETGCGKTTICQVFAALQKKKLYAVNCHLHTETSDFLGGLRPARRETSTNKDGPLRLFEWCDGSLVEAMKEGSMFLADEISLADDSVLERLNSVLEPERTLILAEKGSSSDNIDLIVAEQGFHLLATMNPGGDYGKKELSPALRNRFTEIWCPAYDNLTDMIAIIEHNVSPGITLRPQRDGSSGIGMAVIEFIEWLRRNNLGKRCIVTVRDCLSWVQFINVCSSKSSVDQHTQLEPSQAYFHGAFLVFLDALGLGVMVNSQSRNTAGELCSQFLFNQLKDLPEAVNGIGGHTNATDEAMDTEDHNNKMFAFGVFFIPRGPELSANIHDQYALNAPTTAANAERVMRAMQLHRPILLEGSPGVGKTSLVSALAKASGHRLVRINLSEQTDISDLFGADLPVEGVQGCHFSWCDGPLLLALKSGSWIVLDELNLASQSVLEGLNACFDHRGEIFIPELGMSFPVQHKKTKFFACQNPLHQGGGRKGLPKSFLNRFTQVHVEPLTHNDLLFITQSMYPKIDKNILEKMITFNAKVYQHCVIQGLCRKHGGLWEFNLRDIFRWCDLMTKYQNVSNWNPAAFVRLIYVSRMRTEVCTNQVWELCSSIFGQNIEKDVGILVHSTPSNIQIGRCVFPKYKSHVEDCTFQAEPLYILHRTLKPLESLLICLKMNWLALLVGPKSSGKTSLVRLASQLTGTKLDVLAMNSSIDTTELLGGYEQTDLERPWTEITGEVKEELFRLCRTLLLKNCDKTPDDLTHVLKQWFTFRDGNDSSDKKNVDSTCETNESITLDDISRCFKLLDSAINVCQRHSLTDYSFERLKVRVEELNTRLLQSNGSSHISGQFEWVDGQLVKALKNGHWLLIDNVNFCSPSVLDRLNGLLEPEGELSINERGVVDGEIPVIKPHPDFRLIFAMDSKHGEISRAMRNRGVEIFLMEEDDDIDDLCSMLYASGCKNPTAIQTLSNVHDQGTVLQTIHAGSLMNELWQRGIALEKSLFLSLNHVYGQLSDVKQLLTEQSVLKLEKKPTAKSFQQYGICATIKWHSIPLDRIIQDDSKSDKNVMTAIKIFLEWCSKKDWRMRLDWLTSNMRSCTRKVQKRRNSLAATARLFESYFRDLFDTDAVKQFYDIYEHVEIEDGDWEFDASYQPVNISVNGPVFKYICCKIQGDKKKSLQFKSHTNRVYLLWTMNDFLVAENSRFRGEGTMIDNLLHSLHEYTVLFLIQPESNDILMTDDDVYKIWVSLKQLFCHDFSSDPCVYWKLFGKGAFDTMMKFFEDILSEDHPLQKYSHPVVKHLDKMCESEDLAVCHWKMIKDFEVSSVFVSEEICLLWTKLAKLYAGLLGHKSAAEGGVGPTIGQRREWQKVLLNDMVSLIRIREEEVPKEEAEIILARIEESIVKISQERCHEEIMDQSASDILASFSEISIDIKADERSDRIYGSEIIQVYCTAVANCAYSGCSNLLKLMALRKKILNEINIPDSEAKWNEKLKSYVNFCVGYLREIPFNTAFIQSVLQSSKNNRIWSILKLADDSVFCDLTEIKYPERNTVSNVTTCLLPNTRYSVKTFEELSMVSEHSYLKTDQKQTQVRLVNVEEKIVEYKHFTTFLWLHQNFLANLESTQWSVDGKAFMLAFTRLVLCLNCIDEIPDYQSIFSNLPSFLITVLTSKEFQQKLEFFLTDFRQHGSSIDINVVKECFSRVTQHLELIVGGEVLTDNSKKIESKFDRGLCWIHLGIIQSTLLRPVGNIDPVEETNIKVDMIRRQVEDLSSELNIRLKYEEILTGVVVSEATASDTLQVNPRHVKNLITYRKSLECELSKVGDKDRYRPAPPQFKEITGVLQSFSTSVGNYSSTLSKINDLCSRYKHDSSDEKIRDFVTYAKESINYLKTWVKSVRKFILQLQDFVAYQDILGPYISGLIQIVQGSEMIISVTENKLKWIKYKRNLQLELKVKFFLPGEIVSCVLPFSRYCGSMSRRVGSLLTEELSYGIEALCKSCVSIQEDNKDESEKLKTRVRMLALKVLKRSVCRKGYTNSQDIFHLKTVTNCFKTLWLQLEEDRKLREEEGESLYKFKAETYCQDEESEEQQNQKEVDELFPRFDQDYDDLHMDTAPQNSSLEKKQKCNQHQANRDTILSEFDMAQFCGIHQFLVSCAPNVSHLLETIDNTEWEKVDKRLDDVKIVCEGYNIASEVISLGDLCDYDLVDDATPSHLAMSSLLLKSLSSYQDEFANTDQKDVRSASLLFGGRSDEYDIYHDSNLKEIVQVLPILASFKSRIQQLLEKWPEHPTLVQLCQTIDRIVSFPVTSPVMQILNGLEILLKYSQEWESNASRHVSIRDNLEEVTEMIVRWRKLELRSWSSLLRVCEIKAQKKAHHWWFHVHHVIQQCSVAEDGGSVDFKELIKVLQQFMESSSLGEFSERLKILASFSYQETIDNAENQYSGIVRTILWNILCYYKQFESRVGSLIEKAKAPIEKELKDFIKIIKWKDVNYWAMKETSAKSHHTLLKLIKKYQAAISEGIDGILGSIGQVASFTRPTEQDASSYMLEPTNFLSPITFQNLNLKDTSNEDDRPAQTFSKLRKLTQRKLNSSRYDALSTSVNTFAGEIVDTAHSLQNLEIGNKTGKERTQFCKHIHVLKKRALADLFKRLRKIGLSYRKGISILQKNSLKDPMMVDCGDIMRTLKNIDILFNSSENSNYLPVLKSCTEYYQKCVARSAVLNNVLTSPSKDLTVGDVDRIKGFAEHLRQITQRQRENISMVGKLFSELSMITRQLKNLSTRRPCRLPPQRNVAEWTLKLDDLLNSSLETSESLLCLLDTCPVSRIDLSMSPVPKQLSELSKCCKQDSAYVKLNKDVAAFHEKISLIKSKIYLQTILLCPSSTGSGEGNVFATWSHFECLASSFEQLNETLLYLDEFVKMDTRSDLAKDITGHSGLSFGKHAFYLRQEIKESYSQFTGWYEKTFEETHCNNSLEEQISPLRCEVTSTRKSILLSFQKWYKRRENEIDKAQESVANEEENDDDYFVERLHNELLADIAILNIQERTKDISSCIEIFRRAIDEQYKNYNTASIDVLCGIMISILPCLSQYALLIEYHFHQLLLCHRSSCKLHSVLLEIFSDLLQKGFCLPPDEDELEGEGATSFEDAENCGIDEGEGRKDVSDQIENEEQLLGSEQKKSEEHEKGDDNEIANEEHGIEMSEDFEGETHDVEKSGESSDEDGESGDESEKLKQEMGDVDGADETLDKKLWADSDEENNNGEDDDEDGRGTGAEGENQSEMVAKEENQGSNKDGKNKPQMDDVDEDKINELGKDENDTGNLDDNFTDNKNEMKPDDLQPEEMELPENLDLDFDNDGDNDGGDTDDSMDDNGHDDETAENDNHTDDEIGDNSDLQMTHDQEGNQEANKEEEFNENEQQAGLEKNEEDEGNVKGDEWKTQSETKGENVESVEDYVNPDASSGISASNERSEPTNNDESIVEEKDEGTGNSMSQQSGLDSGSSTTTKTTDLASSDTRSHRKQLNKARNDRSLGSSEEAANKKPKVLNSSEDRSCDDQAKDTSSAELFEHIGDQNETHHMQVLDAATAEQQKQQKSVNYPTETENHDTTENNEKDWELPPEDNTGVADGKKEKSKRNLLFQSDKAHDSSYEETNDVEMSTKDHDEVGKEWLDTKSSVFTGEIPLFADVHTQTLDPEICRGELEELLCKWRDLEEGSPDEQATALDAWHKFEQLTSTHSQQLCEQLRIVLEPSIASKLRGDYRTGKRLNMRKVIPYIASQYRKDKIWLRRTKKSKRQYQILLAMDDSSSMSDNKSKQLAFESLAVITNALTKLEAGEIAICSFGEEVQLLHPFHETFTEQSGANILRQFRFAQKKTKVAQLLDACTSVMTSSKSRVTTGNDVSQLLLLVSDGRGIFLEGIETVHRAVRKAREAGIFLVFVILDNPTNKDSILDIKFPIFKPDKSVELKSYIEQFPFPFYIVLRDISSLPETLGDSLRQWFELVTNMS